MSVALPAEAVKAGQFCKHSLVGKTRTSDNGDRVKCKFVGKYARWVVVASANNNNGNSGGTSGGGTSNNNSGNNGSNGNPPTKPPTEPEGPTTPTTPTTPTEPKPPVTPTVYEDKVVGSSCDSNDRSTYTATSGTKYACVWTGELTSPTGSKAVVPRVSVAKYGQYGTFNDYAYRLKSNGKAGNAKYVGWTTTRIWVNVSQYVYTYTFSYRALGNDSNFLNGNNADLVPYFGANGLPNVWSGELCNEKTDGLSANVHNFIAGALATTKIGQTDPYIGTCSLDSNGFYTWK